MRCQGGTPWVPQWPGAPCLSYFTIASGPSVVGLRVSWLLCPCCSHLHGSPPSPGTSSYSGLSITCAFLFQAPSASGCFYKPNPVGEGRDLSI